MRTSTLLRALGLLMAIGWSTAAMAQTPPQSRLVSTFPLVLEGQFNKAEANAFEELIQGEAQRYLSEYGYTVLTRETTLKVLDENGISAEKLVKACESSCALEAAKELKVKLFVAGSVRRLEDETVSVFIRLFDGESGALLSSTSELTGARLRDAREAFARVSEVFFTRAIDQINDPEVKAKVAEKRRQKQAESRASDDGERPSFFPRKNPILDLDGRLVVRGGLGGLSGILGAGVEWHFKHVALAVGFGSYLTGGVTIKPLGYDDHGGIYLDLHVARSLIGTVKDTGIGATVGYDYRPVRWITLKAGLGGAWTTLAKDAPHARPLVADLSGGLVF